jgi:hypothetical protein
VNRTSRKRCARDASSKLRIVGMRLRALFRSIPHS